VTPLFVEADPEFRARLADELRARSFAVKTAAPDGEGSPSGAASGGAAPISWAILDLRFPGPVGLLVARALGFGPEVKVAVVTGHASIAAALEASPLGPRPGAVRGGARGLLMMPGPPPVAVEASWTLGAATREHIRRVIAYCGGNISEAARRLGLTRRALQIRLKKYQAR
jgi:two-component system response regulator RegA